MKSPVRMLHIPHILKSCVNLIVLGVGIPKPGGSACFPEKNKYNPDKVLLQKTELEAVAKIWRTVAITRNIALDEAVMRKFYQWLREYTGGSLFTFFCIFERVLTSQEVYGRVFPNYQWYLTSREFYTSVV